MDKIKLVIWDLDETFWNGTLSEEGITPIEENIAVIKELCDRGIMNSIVSKNNFEDAKNKLIELGVWEYFVFPIINWNPKGPAIKELIKNCQLRDVNVLFLDDNHLNLKEANYYNSYLYVDTPEFIPKILKHNAFVGKDDSKHTRLQQYKILEQKFESSLDYEDNLSFLRDSKILVKRIENDELLKHTDRIFELLERTNQLNFTKLRSNISEIEQLLNNSEYKSTLIEVSDKFGDYGVVGFYSINIKEHSLKHFTFSCRIINLGVAQYLYALIDFPQLEVIPDVAEKLDDSTPDWITEVFNASNISNINDINQKGESKSIFFKGGCDLGQMTFYLNNRGFRFIEETNYVGRNNFPIHQEHTQVVLDSQYLLEANKKYIQEQSFIPFTDDMFYNTKLFSKEYDCVIYSVLMDYTNEIYVHKDKDIMLPFGGYNLHWSDEKNDDELIERYQKRGININKEVFADFRKEFKHIGQLDPNKFTDNLKKIRSLVSSKTPIIFLNGAEEEPLNSKEKAAKERHIIMNKALDEFVDNSENTYLLDVRKVVTKPNQVTDSIRHYKREQYKDLSINLLSLLNTMLDENIKKNISMKSLIKGKIISNKFLASKIQGIKNVIASVKE